MNLHDVFERVAVISLPKDGARRKRLRENLRSTGIADPGQIEWTRAISGYLAPPPAWWGGGKGAWGCLMSHLRVAQDAAHDRLDSYLVLEDDVFFHERSCEFLERFTAELPEDWGQVYLGGQYLSFQPEIVSPWVLSPRNVNRTHAFALRKKTFPLFLRHVLQAPDYMMMVRDDRGFPKLDHRDWHIDHQLGRAHERGLWKTYTPAWWLAGQEAGKSRVSNRDTSRLWWNWGGGGRNEQLPFFVARKMRKPQRERVRGMLHCGNNLKRGSLTDVGIGSEIGDDQLRNWLRMISREAVEHWKLPGFEPPPNQPGFVGRVRKLWGPGVEVYDRETVENHLDYPYRALAES